jgi:hypothetical protein
MPQVPPQGSSEPRTISSGDYFTPRSRPPSAASPACCIVHRRKSSTRADGHPLFMDSSKSILPSRPPGWSRPTSGPQQAVATAHQFNGNRSPPAINSNSIHLNGQSQIRQSVVPIPVSPHLNGSLSQQVNNNYPPSPHRGMGGTHQIPNGAFVSYASTRPPPQHLTNGGPPLRAPENPSSHSGHQHSSFGTTHTSPPLPRETLPVNREPIIQGQGPRSADGRVNGGASASPSLQNLLS